jgi:hypothetical protein
MPKMITIINPVDNMLRRIPIMLLEDYKAKGYHTTTKGKFKCFMNREIKLHKNKRTLDTITAMQRDKKFKNAPIYKTYTDKQSDKIYAVITRFHRGGTENQRIIVEYPSKNPFRMS